MRGVNSGSDVEDGFATGISSCKGDKGEASFTGISFGA
jgi:hypothetical protein